MKLQIPFLIIIFLVFSCASSKEAQEKYKSLAIEKYKENVDYVYNESKSFVLCVNASKPTALKPLHRVRFFVYDIKNDAIVMEETVVDGSVRWINDHAIEVSYTLGLDSKDPAVPHFGTYKFDVITKQRISDKVEN
ncbi:hypothetical protein F9K33_12075 [bacterium]|nr:MAG: hypothetical protein F9K33_12075 [bacterium]